MDARIKEYQALEKRLNEIISDYSHVKERLYMRIRNKEHCKGELEGLVHREYLEFGVTCHVDLGTVEGRTASMAITHEMLDRWKVSEDQVLEDALTQSPKIRPAIVSSIEEVLRNLIRKHGMNLTPPLNMTAPPLMVLTTENNLYGAAVILYPGLLRDLAEQMGGNLLLIPSSEHEFLAFPDEGDVDTNDAEAMIRDVNQTLLLGRQESILSNYLYGYDRKADQVYRVQDKGTKEVSVK